MNFGYKGCGDCRHVNKIGQEVLNPTSPTHFHCALAAKIASLIQNVAHFFCVKIKRISLKIWK